MYISCSVMFIKSSLCIIWLHVKQWLWNVTYTFSRFLYFTTAVVKCCVAAVKSCLVLHFRVVIFFWSFGIIDSNTFKRWKLSTSATYEGCCTFSLPLMYTIKPSLHFSCNFVVINASKGSHFLQIFTFITM
jgi:hypothetical protein